MGNYYGPLEFAGLTHEMQYHETLSYNGNDLEERWNTMFQCSSFPSWAATTYNPSHPQLPLFSSSAPSSSSLKPPVGRGREYYRQRKRSNSASRQVHPSAPYKHCVDQILDTDGTPVGEIINRDTTSARNAALGLCFPNDHTSSQEDIVFWTDASYKMITESKSTHDQVKQWEQMKQEPEKWHAGVAIAWSVTHSSGLSRHQKHGQTGGWRDEHYTHTPRSISTPKPLWHASHEAAWQITGLQHFNQAELLGITLALHRAVDIFRQAPSVHLSGHSQPTPRSIAIFTDSKAAMWDLTGDNWHTNNVKTESEYWTLREANTAAIVAEAKGYMRQLRDMNVRAKISWVPGHVGVPGNEWVDGLSRFARISGSRFRARSGWKGDERIASWERIDRRLILDSGSDLQRDNRVTDWGHWK